MECHAHKGTELRPVQGEPETCIMCGTVLTPVTHYECVVPTCDRTYDASDTQIGGS